jgi:hypothetical protein
MKKKLIVLLVVLAMTLSVSALAATQKATLINSFGDKVVVAVGSSEAQSYFGQGYVLLGQPLVAQTVTQKVCDCEQLGSAGNTYIERQFFNGSLTQGGIKATTSAANLATFTLTPKELPSGVNVILFNNTANITLTLTATSTKGFIPNVGDVANVYFQNASTTAASTITFAADGTGNVDLQYAEATGGDLVLSGLDWAKLTFIRQTAKKITVIFDEMTEAD